MPTLDERGLRDRLRAAPAGCFLLYGEETYLIKTYVNKIIDAAVEPEFADFNLHRFDGKSATLSDIYDAAIAVPMMAERTCVVVTDYPLEEADEAELRALDRLLEETPEECALVFAYPTVQPKGAKFNAAVKLFDRKGMVVKFARREQAELVRLVESGAKKRGCAFDRGAALYFVTNIGTDLNLLLNELEKVCAYSDGTITRAEVDAVCIKSLEARVFDMIRDLNARRLEGAFRKLAQLFAQREDPLMILGALTASYTDLYRVKAAVASGERPDAAAGYYNYAKKEFRLKNAASAASAMSLPALYECLELLAAADAALKGFGGNERLVLEQTLVQLAQVGRR